MVHYQETIQILEQLLLLSLFSCIYILIGSVCMLLIVPSHGFSNTGFIAFLIASCLSRLAFLLYFGQTVTVAYEKLIWSLRARLQGNMLNCFIWKLLKSRKVQSEFILFGVIKLQQTLALPIVSLILGTVVLLIQTEQSKLITEIQNHTLHNVSLNFE